MPRAYISIEEKEKAALKRAEERENFNLKSVLRDRIFRQLGYEYISEKTKLSRPTIGRVVNNPELATVAQLRAVCAAAGIPLSIIAGEQ